jgi:ABC-2 type transport system permease protein
MAASLSSSALTRGIVARTTPIAAADAVDEVKNGTVDVALVPTGKTVTVLSKDAPAAALLAAVDIGVTRAIGARYLQRDPTAEASYLTDSAAPLRLSLLAPADTTSVQRWVIAYFGGFVMLLSITQFGSGICTGVVEEKSSRVVELLLATVRPIQLLVGKIGGLGVVGIVQTAVIGAAALITGEVTHSVTVGSAAPLMFGAVLLWFVLGYLLFATLFAAAGSTVSRQEDARTVIAPFSVVLGISFYLGVAGARVDNPLVRVLSWVPPFSAFLIPMRVAEGSVGAGEFIGSALIMCAASAAVAVLAARIYQRSILHTGARLRMRHALRGRMG